MSDGNENGNEKNENDQTEGISDDQLPEDLQAEENPLAEPLDEDVDPDDLDMDGGKPADEWDDEQQED